MLLRRLIRGCLKWKCAGSPPNTATSTASPCRIASPGLPAAKSLKRSSFRRSRSIRRSNRISSRRKKRNESLEGEMFQDLRYGARMLVKYPGFTCVAALTLALGIGANTAIFSLIDAVLLKTLPVNNPERVVLLERALGGKTVTQFPYRAYKQIRDQNEVLSGLLAYHPLRLSVSVDNRAEPAVAGQLVSGNYYAVLGVHAALGRTIVPDDDRAPGEAPVCVISHNYWRRRFAGDPAVVGKTVHIGGAPFTIVGVTPPEFFGLEVGSSLDVSVPLMRQQQVMPGIRSYVDGADPNSFFNVMGRLRPGVAMPQAQAGLSALYRQLCAEYAASNWGFKFTPYPWLEEKLVLESGGRGLSELRVQFSRPLLALMIVVALVLAVACANVAGPLLAPGVAPRQGNFDRPAVGRWASAAGQATAHRERIAQQLRRLARTDLRLLGNPAAPAAVVAGRNPRPTQSQPRRPHARLHDRGGHADRRVVRSCARVPGGARGHEFHTQKRSLRHQRSRRSSDLRQNVRRLAGRAVVAPADRGRIVCAELAEVAAG